MAKKKKVELDLDKDIASALADSINQDYKESGEQVAFFFEGIEESPSYMDNWVSTGIDTLDFMISNKKNGGLPVGRIVELTGMEASGKSLLATHILAETQKQDGIAVYIDTESAFNTEFAKAIGIDLSKVLYLEQSILEDVYTTVNNIIERVRSSDKDKLVTIVIDSMSATTPRKEAEADFDKDGYATDKAIINSKAMRKITRLISKENILLVLTNQLRTKMGVMFGDPYCVDPLTTKVKVKYTIDNEIQTLTLSELARKIDITDFKTPKTYDISEDDIQIETMDSEGNEFFSPITSFVVKNSVDSYWTDGKIKVSSNHKFVEDNKEILAKDHPDFHKVNESIDIVDIEVPETGTYLANGRLNHNTTSGGKAIGFHSSVRLRMKGLGKIKAKIHGIEETIGVKTRVEIKKNRCGPPFRTCDFDIYFDRGADNFGAILNGLKDYKIVKTGGAWYSYTSDSGEDFKFQSKDFKTLMTDNTELKTELYDKMADKMIRKYSDVNKLGIDDVEFQEEQESDE